MYYCSRAEYRTNSPQNSNVTTITGPESVTNKCFHTEGRKLYYATHQLLLDNVTSHEQTLEGEREYDLLGLIFGFNISAVSIHDIIDITSLVKD